MFSGRTVLNIIRYQPSKKSFSAFLVKPKVSSKLITNDSCKRYMALSYGIKSQNQFTTVRSFSNASSAATATSFYVQDEEDFKARVIDTDVPIVVDFYADWCQPCKQLGPRLEKEVDRYGGKVLLAKVDIDDLGQLAMEHQIMVVPTVMIFKGGEVVEKFQGNIDDKILKTFIAKALES